MIGIRFEIPNEYGFFLKKIFDNVNLLDYYWNVIDEEILFLDDFSLEKEQYSSSEMKKILDKKMYLILANMQLVRGNLKSTNIKSFEDFCESDCELLLLIVDSSYVDIYIKDEKKINIIKENAEKNNYKNIEYIYDDGNLRNIFSF